MARLFDFMKYDKDERGADVDEGTRLELRRLANLFLISALTLIALFLLRSSRRRCTSPSSRTVGYVVWGSSSSSAGRRRWSTACS